MRKIKLSPKTKKRLQLSLAFACVISLTYGLTAELVSTDNTEPIMRINDETYTIKDFYMGSKKTADTQELLISFLMSEGINHTYGHLVTDDDVSNKLKEITEQIEDDDAYIAFAAEANEANINETIRQQLIIDAALRDVIDITNEEINEGWENFHGTTNIDIALFDEKIDAENFIETIDGNFDDAIVRSNAINQEDFKISFDSFDDTVLTAIKTAAWDLADNEVSKPIVVTNTETSKNQYYVIRKESEVDKDDVSKPHERIIQHIKEEKLQDPEVASNAMAKILENANIKTIDPDLDSLIKRYSNQEVGQD